MQNIQVTRECGEIQLLSQAFKCSFGRISRIVGLDIKLMQQLILSTVDTRLQPINAETPVQLEKHTSTNPSQMEKEWQQRYITNSMTPGNVRI